MLKILVVEDDRNLNKSVCSYLNGYGFQAHGVLNADLAFESLYSNKYFWLYYAYTIHRIT